MNIRRLLCIGLIALMVSSSTELCASDQNYFQQVYKAYIDGEIAEWSMVIVQMESTDCKTESCMLDLINVYYGYTGYLISLKDYSSARAYIDKAENMLESILKTNSKNATAYAYMGAFMGFSMNIDPIKMPVLGPKSYKYIEEALHQDPNNIQSLIEKANALYYAPELFGGSKKSAIHYYVMALKQMETSRMARKNWLYMKTLLDLANAYIETDHPEEALKLYKRILSLEPDFKLVRDELYPELLDQLSAQASGS